MTSAAMIVTSDPALADDLLRLAAAANAPAEVAHTADQACNGWHWQPLILVGVDLAEAVAAEALPRRPGVVLIARAGDTSDGYRSAVEIGAQDLAVLPDEEAWLIDALAAAAEPVGAQATTICVRGARGGAGTSVLAAVFAQTAARAGLRTLLIDGDPYGGGIDLVLGVEDEEGARWPDLADRRGRLSPATLREALPRLGDLSVLSWRRGVRVPVAQEAVQSVLGAASRGFDLIVVDVARHPGEIGRAALRAADAGFLLVPAEVRATVAAGGVRDEPADLRLIVTAPAPGGLTPDMVSQALNLPLAGVLDHDRRIPAALEDGGLLRAVRRGSLAGLCAQLVNGLDLQQAHPEAA